MGYKSVLTQHLRQVIFTESNDCPEGGALNRALDAEGGGINVTQDVARTKPSYYGPVNSDCSSDKWRVGLRFKAADKNSGYVNVYAPLDPFICTMNNRTGKSEGLVCAPAATGADKSPSPYALGINFFQAMFVSMHNIGKGNLSKSFVHMAPQYPEERTTYIPPPISL
ncbi:hypothetical protein C2E23DRAFT_427496 [Lenzites betulinus]|nr:hypothetical protein C2E23DRAFT_427496 [Lenzites betulinus]